jgi:hypothetical protein
LADKENLTDGQMARLIPVYLPYNFVVQGYNKQESYDHNNAYLKM